MHEKLDNPLVFIVLVSVGVAAVWKAAQFGFSKLGWAGGVSFFGGNPG
jgi:hypothetical protein